ncbi:V-set domain-containing T-cell activation inhibitor 1-like [Paramisgurnus dabryanus]|uniref:V-set domain-containing T-cell activation inhibitor 1-like n=1 Tax=Paramisgurnus dabryanus TaxID=90735 RepID=UPI003CCFAC04
MDHTTAFCCKAAFHTHYSFSIYRCCFICVFLLLIISTASSHKVIEGVEGENITLQCSHTNVKLTRKNLVVHWRHNDIRNVHDIIQGRISVQEQDSIYENRAFVNLDECLTGDCSLTLTQLQASDGGMYLCYIPAMGVFQNAELIVKGRSFREYRADLLRSHGTETRPSLILIPVFGFILHFI